MIPLEDKNTIFNFITVQATVIGNSQRSIRLKT